MATKKTAEKKPAKKAAKAAEPGPGVARGGRQEPVEHKYATVNDLAPDGGPIKSNQ